MAFYCQVVFLVFSSVQSLSPVQLFATLWTVARQVPLSVAFPRQGYWSPLFMLVLLNNQYSKYIIIVTYVLGWILC